MKRPTEEEIEQFRKEQADRDKRMKKLAEEAKKGELEKELEEFPKNKEFFSREPMGMEANAVNQDAKRAKQRGEI